MNSTLQLTLLSSVHTYKGTKTNTHTVEACKSQSMLWGVLGGVELRRSNLQAHHLNIRCFCASIHSSSLSDSHSTLPHQHGEDPPPSFLSLQRVAGRLASQTHAAGVWLGLLETAISLERTKHTATTRVKCASHASLTTINNTTK